MKIIFIVQNEDVSYYEKLDKNGMSTEIETPFELPDGWAWCRGYECFNGMESRKPMGTCFKYIDIDSIDNNKQQIREAKIVDVHKAPSRASRAVFEGSVLFSLVRPYLKNIAIVEADNSDSIASTGFYVATSNGTFYPRFLYFLMMSNYVVTGLNQFMKGDNSPSISKEDILKWLYPVPPFAEQIRIVEHIENYTTLLKIIESSLT